MQALVLAAGKGRRIQGLTGDEHKALLPFRGTTLIGSSLRQLAAVGVSELIVVVGYRREALIEHVRELWEGEVQFVLNPLYAETNVLFSFWLASQKLEGDFFYLHADTVFETELLRRIAAAPIDQDVLPFDRHLCGAEEMKVRLEGDRVVALSKEMAPESAQGEFIGLARFRAASLPVLKSQAELLLEEGRCDAFFEAALQRAIDREDLSFKACDITGLAWNEIDFEEDYREALRRFSGR